MNNMIIRICEIALSSITELQMQNERHFRDTINDITPLTYSTFSVNKALSENNRAFKILEDQKEQVKQLMDIAYKKEISLK